ncbi:MAG: guanylate kinase [Clostridia bacterium]|nr:guanylate kinase [Clostridia bacterium]
MSDGTLLVFSGPAGAGKDSVLIEFLKKKVPGVWKSVSYTTRAPRKGEIDGIDYKFVTPEEFEKLIENNFFLEYAKYGVNYYGTPKSCVDKHLEDGDVVILKIEVQGAEQIKNIYPQSIGAFIVPPSLEILEKRLRERGTETDEDILRRLRIAEDELAYSSNYDYQIINDRLEDAVDDLTAVIRALQLKNK